jgi:hypothetical protein
MEVRSKVFWEEAGVDWFHRSQRIGDLARASGLLIGEAELAQQTAKVVCEDRFHLAVETAQILRRGPVYPSFLCLAFCGGL